MAAEAVAEAEVEAETLRWNTNFVPISRVGLRPIDWTQLKHRTLPFLHLLFKPEVGIRNLCPSLIFDVSETVEAR